MNAIAEIDKSGRIVVPKKLRAALHLIPGTRLAIQLQGAGFLAEPESAPRGLSLKNGILVYDTGPLPPDHVNWVEKNRDGRNEELMGEWPKS
jgi:AbrB family looped-hinge helix DNA binding protein